MGIFDTLDKKSSPTTSGIFKELDKKKSSKSIFDKLDNPPVPLTNKAINYGKEVVGTLGGVGDFIQHPLKTTYDAIHSSFLDPAREAGLKAGQGIRDVFTAPTGAGKVAGAANALTGAVSIPLTAISGLTDLATKNPITKVPADAFNKVFEYLGKPGEFVANKFVSILPVSDESKEVIRQPLKEVGSLASQIILGGKITKLVESKLGKKITPDEVKKLVVESKSEATQIPIKTPLKLEVKTEIPKTTEELFNIIPESKKVDISNNLFGKDSSRILELDKKTRLSKDEQIEWDNYVDKYGVDKINKLGGDIGEANSYNYFKDIIEKGTSEEVYAEVFSEINSLLKGFEQKDNIAKSKLELVINRFNKDGLNFNELIINKLKSEGASSAQIKERLSNILDLIKDNSRPVTQVYKYEGIKAPETLSLKTAPIEQLPVTPKTFSPEVSEPIGTKTQTKTEPVSEPPKTEFESRSKEAREEIISKIPEDDIIKIASGDLPSPNNIPSTAYLTFISKKATEQRLKGDVTLANKLAESSQGRFAAQALEAMKGEDPYIKTVREIKNSYLDKLPKEKQVQRERMIKSVEEGVSRLYEEINNVKPTRSARLKFLRDNMC